MAEEFAQERTEQPTTKHLEDARKRGEVARSRELTTMCLLLTASGAMLISGDRFIGDLADMMRRMLSMPTRELLAADNPVSTLFLNNLMGSLLDLAPLFVALTLVAALSPLAIGGWNLSMEAMELKWERLDPMAGLGRIFSAQSAAELGKALAKFLLLVVLGVWVFMNYLPQLLHFGYADMQASFTESARLIGKAFLILCSGTVIIALFDVPWQLFSHTRKLRMTRQQIKEESKETEGRPEIKGKIRQMQHELATRRMMDEVPKADVVVTNPTHYAVALRYEPGGMAAPRVVAKGVDDVAARIRAVANKHKVMTLSAPPLARALYYSTKLDQEVPAGLYMAVARVLAYVFQLRTRGNEAPVTPPTDLPIPEDLRRDG